MGYRHPLNTEAEADTLASPALARDHEVFPTPVTCWRPVGLQTGRVKCKEEPAAFSSLSVAIAPLTDSGLFSATCGQAGHCQEPGACCTERQFMNCGYFVCLLESTKICHLCG